MPNTPTPTTTPSPPTIILPSSNPPTTFDPKGVIEAAQGIVPEKGNGFIPVTAFPSAKPYEDWEKYLNGRQIQVEQSAAKNDTRVTALEAKNDALRTANDTALIKHLNDRLADALRCFESRTAELVDHHKIVLGVKDDRITDLEKEVADLEAEKKRLDAQHEADVRQHLAAQTTYHDEILRLTREVTKVQLERFDAEKAALESDKKRLEDGRDALVRDQMSWLERFSEKCKTIKLGNLFDK